MAMVGNGNKAAALGKLDFGWERSGIALSKERGTAQSDAMYGMICQCQNIIYSNSWHIKGAATAVSEGNGDVDCGINSGQRGGKKAGTK